MPDTEPAAPPTIMTVSALSAMPTTAGLVQPGDHPIEVRVIQPIRIILIRATRVYLQTLLGLVVAGMAAPTALPAKDFLHLVLLCMSLSVASSVVSLLQNSVELFNKLDQKYPSLTS